MSNEHDTPASDSGLPAENESVTHDSQYLTKKSGHNVTDEAVIDSAAEVKKQDSMWNKWKE